MITDTVHFISMGTKKQCGEHIITSERKTESCLPICLRRCCRKFSTNAATAVSHKDGFLPDLAERSVEVQRGKKAAAAADETKKQAANEVENTDLNKDFSIVVFPNEVLHIWKQFFKPFECLLHVVSTKQLLFPTVAFKGKLITL